MAWQGGRQHCRQRGCKHYDDDETQRETRAEMKCKILFLNMKYGLVRMNRNDGGRNRLHTNHGLKKSSACTQCAKNVNGYDDDDNDNDSHQDDNGNKNDDDEQNMNERNTRK